MTQKTKGTMDYFQQKENHLMEWVGFWRKNPHLFARDYLGLHLFLYQKILLYMMNKVSLFMYIAARGRNILAQINRNVVWNGGIKLEA
ncbi:hypothetical protein [Limosilactobacillus reuteri]|uniref:hypothetical protein n=1 Tax=Limosilactobacillus reuteri TaxID=1598 RepID=UPI001E495D16|nr:hypothetical protein [Limosilactobacillus reuteri]MCC4466854.1 hypothetical protein [Limosilactobacillus reuteri]MCC4472900.1 hypothetical protein [Limosilactobacillus reuteri]